MWILFFAKRNTRRIFKPETNEICVCSVVSDSVNSLTVAHQAPLSIGFPRQEYWNGLPFPSPGDLTNPGIDSASPALASGLFTTSTT